MTDPTNDAQRLADETRESLNEYLSVFDEYSRLLKPLFKKTRRLNSVRAELQRLVRPVSIQVTAILGNTETVVAGTQYSIQGLFEEAVSGGSNERRDVFPDFGEPVIEIVHRAIGVIENGDWPNKTVFLVHGTNTGVRDSVHALLVKFGLRVTVLEDEPNLGRTIIEKFEEESPASFAVIVMSGDDKGGPAGSAEDDLKKRARQNVVFELGYFIGKLGRDRTAALYETGVELPSDYQGVLYTRIDSEGAWKTKLAQELKAAGLLIDLNDL